MVYRFLFSLTFPMKDWLTLYTERAKKKHEKKKTKEQKVLEKAIETNQKNVENAWSEYFNK